MVEGGRECGKVAAAAGRLVRTVSKQRCVCACAHKEGGRGEGGMRWKKRDWRRPSRRHPNAPAARDWRHTAAATTSRPAPPHGRPPAPPPQTALGSPAAARSPPRSSASPAGSERVWRATPPFWCPPFTPPARQRPVRSRVSLTSAPPRQQPAAGATPCTPPPTTAFAVPQLCRSSRSPLYNPFHPRAHTSHAPHQSAYHA